MVIGQTLGLTEYRTGKPFQGQAGKGIRGELSKLGVYDFDREVFSSPRLEDYVSTSQEWEGRVVVFFPHTSGNARWLNNHANKLLFGKAKNLLRIALLERGVITA